MRLPWFQLAMLGWEANQVVALRMAKLAAGGPAAALEAQLMIAEKVWANMAVGQMMMLGGTPKQAVRHYRRAVKANASRLSKPERRER